MIIICPGFHPPQLTADFLNGMGWGETTDFLVVPSTILPYDGLGMSQWLFKQVSPETSLCFVGFSAGVVGAITTAFFWENNGGTVNTLIAVDGWGVPLFGSFPIYRVSHDEFTYFTSQLLGRGKENFFCSPEVAHLDLWRNPDQVWGWWEVKLGCRVRCSAAKMINEILLKYREKI